MKCKYCGKDIRPCNIERHELACENRSQKQREMRSLEETFKVVDGKYECPVCHVLFSKRGIRGHYWRAYTEDGRAFGEAALTRPHKPSNQYIKAKELGLPKPEVSKETRQKLSEKNLQRSLNWHIENGKKVSATIREKVAAGEWHTSLAKRMHYSYKGEDLHGKWELAYAMFLDQKNIPWKRCKDKFAYEFEGKLRFYTPDFYLPETKEYVEIKGYKTKKDDAKWSQFPHTLVVLRGRELKELVSEFEDLSSLVKL